MCLIRFLPFPSAKNGIFSQSITPIIILALCFFENSRLYDFNHRPGRFS